MKKLIFCLFVVFVGKNVYSQDYVPIIQEGSFWDSSELLGGICTSDYYRYRISNDTLIAGNTYKKLQLAQFAGDDDDPNYPCRIYFDPMHVQEYAFQDIPYYIREDVAEKKVYMWADLDNTSSFQEYILYDFTLEVGDVLTADYVIGEGAELTSIELDSEGRKQYHFFNNAAYYTEGIGSSVEIVSFNRIIGEGDRQLFCWGNNTNQNGCGATLSVDEEQLEQIKVFPNPASDKISLTNLENNTFRLYSILGKEMTYQFSEQTQQIDISHLRAGIYLLEIRGANDSKRVVKVMKQ